MSVLGTFILGFITGITISYMVLIAFGGDDGNNKNQDNR